MDAIDRFSSQYVIMHKYHFFMWISSIMWYVRCVFFLVVREAIYNVDRGKLEAYLQQ